MKGSTIVFIALLICLFLFANYKTGYILSYDEARHAVQGHFLYDYLRTILSGDIMSLKTFLGYYQQRGYNIGWNALYDPPAHALAQAITFMIFGASTYTSRLATLLIICFGSFLLFFISRKILKNVWLAIAAVFLYLLYPYAFEFSRESIPDMAAALLMVGWFYFFFYREPKYFSFVLSRRLRLRINLFDLVSAIFLTSATLMKYQNLIFASLFMAIYTIILFVTRWDKDFFSTLKSSGAWSIVKRYTLIVLVFLLLGGWWLKFSLIDSGMFQRVFFEGMQRQTTGDVFFYFKELAFTTFFAVFLAVVPFVMPKSRSYFKDNWHVLLFILVTLGFATFFISNQKIRYMIAAVPFIFIFMVQGLSELTLLLKRFYPYAFTSLVVLLLVPFVLKDIAIMDSRVKEYGSLNSEVVDFIKSIPDPKLLVYPKGGGKRSVNYTATPDLFAFEAMTAKKDFNPKNMRQLVEIDFWDGGIENNPAAYFTWLNQTQLPTYVFVYRYEPDSTLLQATTLVLPTLGYTTKNLTYFIVFQRK
ncbi:MAG: glycosyltransferase family 39 protein [Candidatus Woesearchaeota archaeon]